MIAKYILAWFGGGTAIWSTCMLFFQLLLLAGYAYANLLVQKFSVRNQTLIHFILLAVSLAFLPVTPNPEWKPISGAEPTPRILALLLVTLGLPYFCCRPPAHCCRAGSRPAIRDDRPIVSTRCRTSDRCWRC